MVALTLENWQQLCQIAYSWDVATILLSQQHLRESEVQVKLSTQPQLGSASNKRGIGRVEGISHLQLVHAMPFV